MIAYKASDLKNAEAKDMGQFCGVKEEQQDKRDSEEEHHLDSQKSTISRSKRSSKPLKKKCQVLLVADYLFYRDIGSSDYINTTKYMIHLLDLVDDIFSRQKLGDCGYGFGLEIKEIKIHSGPDNTSYNSVNPDWEPTQLLQSFSGHDYSKFCMAFLLTGVALKSDVLGLAHSVLPIPWRKSGGICSESNNTAWSRFTDRYGKRILGLQAQLVVAHEFGHAFGSHHDHENSKTCIYMDSNGYFLMHSISVTGLQPNNRIFSPCSAKQICTVLHLEPRCFKDADKERGFCGNYRVEGNESCDEGPKKEGEKDFFLSTKNHSTTNSCCSHDCLLYRDAQCSDVNDPCCEDCHYANSSKICLESLDDPCISDTYCTGDSKKCPPAAVKPNGTICRKTGRCWDNKCRSLCELKNLLQCLCEAEEDQCKLCCQANSSVPCTPYRRDNESSLFENAFDSQPCRTGICMNGTCQMQASQSVYRSWAFIQFESVAHFVKFMKNNIVGSVIVVSLLLWIPASCGVSYIDRKRFSQMKEDDEWRKSSSLIPQHERHRTKLVTSTRTIDRNALSESFSRRYNK